MAVCVVCPHFPDKSTSVDCQVKETWVKKKKKKVFQDHNIGQ